MAADMVKEANLDRDACPVLETDLSVLARRGVKDARRLMHDVRQIDPAEVWGRLSRWRRDDPERLLMAVVTLAAYVPEDAAGLLDWTNDLAGGLIALTPQRVPKQRGAA